MHPGPGRRGRRYFPPVARFGPEEVAQNFPLTLSGPVNEYGAFAFDGWVRLDTAVVTRPIPYLFVVKTWPQRPEPVESARRWIVPASEFAEHMRVQDLELAVDKFGTARVYESRSRRSWERQVGISKTPSRVYGANRLGAYYWL